MDNQFTENTKNYFAPMHTAEHILNQTMVRMFGCNRSFSNHIERKKSKCDYYFDRNLSQNEIEDINTAVNYEIIKCQYVTEEFLKRPDAEKEFDLKNLPDSAGETVRIIRIGTYDSCPCSGEHVKNTSEIGEFEITTYSYENGVLRLRYKLK
jgi:Ser-tRNA(Ala) deacylase AlaX